MTALEDHDVPMLPRGVRLHHCAVREAWFLLAPERALKVDAIGVAVLKAVDGGLSFDQIVSGLAAEYDAPAARIAADARAFLERLLVRRMLEVAP